MRRAPQFEGLTLGRQLLRVDAEGARLITIAEIPQYSYSRMGSCTHLVHEEGRKYHAQVPENQRSPHTEMPPAQESVSSNADFNVPGAGRAV